MRQLTAADLAVLASPHYAVHVRVLVTDADGVERDLTDLEGIDWFAGAEWSEDIDQPIVQPRIQIRREDTGTGLSLSPLDEESPLNRRANGTYAPLIDAGRRIRIYTATVPPGAQPGPGDWREVFDGEIDEVEWQMDPMTVICRDPGGVLQDTIIENPQEYGSESGVLLHVVMQQLLDDVLGAGVVTLHVPEPPAFMVTRYKPDEGPLLEALQACAGAIGWDVRYAWHEASQAFELTLIRPDREKTTPDHVFGPDDYIDVTRLAVSRADVRNVVQVRYQDSTTRQQERVTVQDDASIARYGRRYMRIVEGEDSPIDTAPEALVMAEAALSDLAEPRAEQEIELRYWWPAQLGDLYRFKANGVHYTTDQVLAVVGIRHRLSENQQRTILTCRGKPSGGYLTWLKRSKREPEITAVEALPPQAIIDYVTEDPTTVRLRYSGQLGEGGTGPLEYRRRVGPSGSWGPGSGDGWASLPGSGVEHDVTRPAGKRGVLVYLEVRDAAGRVGATSYLVEPRLDGLDDDGLIDITRQWGGGGPGLPYVMQTVDGGERARGTIEPGGGVLRPGVAGSDGATPKLLAKGLVHGMCWNGMAIQYEQPYQNTPPVVIYQGPTDDERDVWYPSLEQAIEGTAGTPGPRPSPARIRQMFIADASPSGFTPRLVLVALGTPTPRSTTFASPTVISVGGASGAATPSAAQTPALGDQYDADYTCTVQRPPSLIGDVQLIITLAIEVSLNAGAWVEVMTKQVTLWLFADQDAAQASGSIRFTAAISGGNDQVRLRFKDLVTHPAASPPPSPSVSVGLLRWNQDADVRYANATPDGEADAIPFVVLTQG